ncbi:beta-casein [Lemur catta]|uniref:beta-casein n=1 Tax=Lemur catta TaxID=9447 RepID=UPI001E26BF3E|nr:beta-casein [Lemur catta]
MKVLILACLVALALAKESVESLSGSEESVTHDKQKSQKGKHEEQKQREDELQENLNPFIQQQQPLVYPFAQPIPYTIPPQNILSPLAQPAVVPAFLQSEVMEVSKSKETAFPKRKVMSFLKSPAMPSFDPQNPNLKNQPLALPLLQPLMYQVPQPIPQTSVLPPQSLWSPPQSKALPIPQQVVPYPQRAMPIQALVLYQAPTARQFYPATQQPLAPGHNPVINREIWAQTYSERKDCHVKMEAEVGVMQLQDTATSGGMLRISGNHRKPGRGEEGLFPGTFRGSTLISDF